MKTTTGILASLLALAISLIASPAAAQSADALFDRGSLHEIRLAIHSADWRRLQANFGENTYYPADFTWRGTRVRNVGIRSRGYGSRYDRKPGLRVDIDRYSTGQRFLGLKSFILDNALQDDSLIKERVTMELFARMGIAAPRVAHARVYVNDEYLGAYALVESVDKDFIERVSGPAAADGEERDGYLFEYQWQFPYYFSYLGPDTGPYAAIFEPKTHEHESPDRIFGPLRDLCRLITESSDGDFETAVGAYIDLDQFVRIAAVENFVSELDGLLGRWGMNNFYLYRFEASTLSRIVPWDKDQTFAEADHPIDYHLTENVLMRRALDVPRLRALYFDALLECARIAAEVTDADGRGWLEREIEGAWRQIKEAVEEDRAKIQSNAAFEEAVLDMLAFARARGAFVACEVARAHGADALAPCAADAASSSRRR